MTRDDEILRGNRAAELLASEAYRTVMDELAAENFRRWKTLPGVEERERLYADQRAIELLDERLRSMAAAGKLAKRDIELEEAERKARAERGIAPGDPL